MAKFGSRTHSRLTVVLFIIFLILNVVKADTDTPGEEEPQQGSSMPDLLEMTSLPAATKSSWRQVSRYMWDWLLANDHDFYDSNGNVVSSTSPNLAAAANGRAVQCGRFSRQLIRMAFHDCGTFSRFLKRYGCNGSVRKEIPRTEAWYDYTKLNPDGKSFVELSQDVFDQFRNSDGELHPAVDVAFNPDHQENNGLAATVAALYQAKMYANSGAVGLWDVSFADILVLGSLLALARCEGPHVRFVPGRSDSNRADTADLLPNFQDDFHHTLFYFLGNGMSELDGLVLIGGAHSTACFHGGCLDATPSKTDKLWAEHVLNWDGQNPPLCNNTGAPTTSTSGMCMAPSDTLWLQHIQTTQYLQLMLSTATTIDDLQQQINQLLDKQGVNNYGGLIPTANLCVTTSRFCPGLAENFAYHTLLATSMFRLTHLIPVAL